MKSCLIAVVLLTIAGAAQAMSPRAKAITEGPTLPDPPWAAAPGFADLAAAYPARAGGAEGSVSLICRFKADGRLRQCAVDNERPGGLGFGRAALSLADKFKVAVDPAWSMGDDAFGVVVPIRFSDPAGSRLRDRRIEQPTWLTQPNPEAMTSLFPPRAADKGLTTGRGLAACKVAPDGRLGDCRPLEAEPGGEGFSEAAVKAASAMRMNLWTRAGGPVDEAVVRVPIRFSVTAETAAPETLPSDGLRILGAPSGDQIIAVYPRRAVDRGVSGHVDLRCWLQGDGRVGLFRGRGDARRLGLRRGRAETGAALCRQRRRRAQRGLGDAPDRSQDGDALTGAGGTALVPPKVTVGPARSGDFLAMSARRSPARSSCPNSCGRWRDGLRSAPRLPMFSRP